MTVEVHHLSRLALKCNLLGDRRQARRKHRQLHLWHPTSLGQLSPPRNRSAHYRSKGTQKTPGTSGGQRLVGSEGTLIRSGNGSWWRRTKACGQAAMRENGIIHSRGSEDGCNAPLITGQSERAAAR